MKWKSIIIGVKNSTFMISRVWDKIEKIISELAYSCEGIIHKEIYKEERGNVLGFYYWVRNYHKFSGSEQH